MIWFIYAYIFMLGAAFGSFGLVVAERWQKKKDWVKSRSKCDSCHRKLQPIDLIPLFSWLFLRGRCRRCHSSVSWVYPATELLMAGLMLISWRFFPFKIVLENNWDFRALTLFMIWIFGLVLMLILSLIDIKKMLLPYKFLIPLIGTALVYRAFVWIFGLSLNGCQDLLAAILLGFGVFATLWYFSKGKWIGDSDVLLGLAIALFLGNIFRVWMVLLLASTLGLVVGLIVAKKNKKSIKGTRIPFGPFLMVGLIIALLFSEPIIHYFEILIFSQF